MSILNALHRKGLLTRLSSSYKVSLQNNVRKEHINRPHLEVNRSQFDPVRFITFSFANLSKNSEKENTAESDNTTVNETPQVTRKVVSVETSIKYMTSDAYKQTYGDEPVWKPYKRNHKGMYPPKKTRRTCIRADNICGNPCPICRDEYLVLDHRNVKLIEQFINKYNGDTLSYQKTGICQKRHKELLVALTRAKDYGTIVFDVPIRQYDYSEWQEPKN